MKLFITILSFLIFPNLLFSQLDIGNPNSVRNSKSKKLIIQLAELNKEFIEVLEKNEKFDLIEKYKKGIEKFNLEWVDMVKKYWYFKL